VQSIRTAGQSEVIKHYINAHYQEAPWLAKVKVAEF